MPLRPLFRLLTISASVLGMVAGTGAADAAGDAAASPAARPTVMVAYDDVAIETIVQGEGPAIVILPSLGRDGYEDYDAVAGMLVGQGFRVLRPQPRGIGASTGPMDGVLLPALARDIAEVIRQQGEGAPSSSAMPTATSSRA